MRVNRAIVDAAISGIKHQRRARTGCQTAEAPIASHQGRTRQMKHVHRPTSSTYAQGLMSAGGCSRLNISFCACGGFR